MSQTSHSNPFAPQSWVKRLMRRENEGEGALRKGIFNSAYKIWNLYQFAGLVE
jgi:hypothetical protein